MFVPDKECQHEDLMATTGDFLRIWKINEDVGGTAKEKANEKEEERENDDGNNNISNNNNKRNLKKGGGGGRDTNTEKPSTSGQQEKQRQQKTSTTAVRLLFIDSEGWPVVLKRLLFVYSAGVSMKTMKIPRSLGFF